MAVRRLGRFIDGNRTVAMPARHGRCGLLSRYHNNRQRRSNASPSLLRAHRADQMHAPAAVLAAAVVARAAARLGIGLAAAARGAAFSRRLVVRRRTGAAPEERAHAAPERGTAAATARGRAAAAVRGRAAAAAAAAAVIRRAGCTRGARPRGAVGAVVGAARDTRIGGGGGAVVGLGLAVALRAEVRAAGYDSW